MNIRTASILSLAVLSLTATLSVTGDASAQRVRRERPQQPAPNFTVEVEHGRLPAISQGRAGTCWAFATMSFLESEVERIHGEAVDLSELHTVYHAYAEKAERFVRLHGKAQFSQGGLSHDVMAMVREHGIVRQSDYSGLLAGERDHDHTEMEKLLKAIIDQVAESGSKGDKWQAALRGVLSAYLGEPPRSITVDGKSMTPQEYASDVLKIRPRDYVEVMSYRAQPYWERTQLLVPDNWMLYGGYWNVPLEDFLEGLDIALRAGYTAAIDIDMSEPTTRGRNPVWTLPGELEAEGAITEELRQEMFDTRATTDDHLMQIVGIARDDSGKVFYLTKNSHGGGGPYEGHLYISRNYLAAKLLSYMVHKDALPKQVAEKMGG